MEWIFGIAVSFVVGAVSAVFGVGGGFILVPVLNSLMGTPIDIAVGSTACYVLGPATTALLYRRVQRIDWRLPLIITGGLMVGVLLGGSTLNFFKKASHTLLSADVVVLGVYLILLSVLGVFSLWESERAARFRPIPRGWLNQVLIPPVRVLEEWNDRRVSITVLVWFGVAVGFLSGLLGISGGLLIVPGLLYLFAVPAQQTIASSMIVVWIVSFQSTIMHGWSGNIDLALVASLLAGGTIGARFGSSVGRRLGSQQLRRNFGVLALCTAAFVAIRLLF